MKQPQRCKYFFFSKKNGSTAQCHKPALSAGYCMNHFSSKRVELEIEQELKELKKQ